MKNFKKIISGKGYYIALILCAFAIGICGYLYYQNAEEEPPAAVSVNAQQPTLSAQQKPSDPAATEPLQPLRPEATGPEATVTTKPVQTAMPLEGQVVAGYAMEALAYNPTTRDWRVHSGIDLAAPAGTPVTAAADGTVTRVYEDDALGYTVVLTHPGGYESCYASLAEEVTVTEGQTVRIGTKLGTVGNTALLEGAIGDHLHFAVTCGGVEMDPLVFVGQKEE